MGRVSGGVRVMEGSFWGGYRRGVQRGFGVWMWQVQGLVGSVYLLMR